MEFYATIAQLVPILMVAMLLETRYAERMQARLRTTQGSGPYFRTLSVFARGVLPWLQLMALSAAFTAEVLAIHVLAVGRDSTFTRAFVEYATYLVLGVLVMGLVDIASALV
jgi:hypothetical protein